MCLSNSELTVLSPCGQKTMLKNLKGQIVWLLFLENVLKTYMSIVFLVKSSFFSLGMLVYSQNEEMYYLLLPIGNDGEETENKIT